MGYESFKVQLISVLSSVLPDAVQKVIQCVDFVAQGYDFSPKPSAVDNPAEPMELFLEAKAVEEKSKRTIKLYRSVLSNFFSAVNKPIASITTQDVRGYLSSCKNNKHHATVTISNTRRILNGFFEWCVLESLIAINPVKRITAIKVGKSPRHAMQRTELEYLRNACESLRDKALIDFLYSTGGRVSEVCNARISDINWEKKSVLIQHGKGDKTRITYLNPEAEVSLRAYLDSRTDKSPYIFARVRGQSTTPLDPKTIQEAVEKIVRRANRQFSVRITPHVFRHTIATVTLRNGMPLEQVQLFLGHSRPETTLIYADISDDDVRRSHAMYAA